METMVKYLLTIKTHLFDIKICKSKFLYVSLIKYHTTAQGLTTGD